LIKKEKKYWLDNPRNVDKIIWVICSLCALLMLLDFFYHKHIHFSFEGWFGFYGIFGFLGYVGFVLGAKKLRQVLMRKGDYYDE